LQGISQNDTGIYLEARTAREVIKDLIKGDAAIAENLVLNEKIPLLEEKVMLQGAVIQELSEKVVLLEEKIRIKDEQLFLSSKANDDLKTAIKKSRRKNKIMGISVGGTIVVAVVGILLISK